MSVAPAMIRALIDAIERSGVPKQAFLDAASLQESRLSDASGRFEFEEYGALHLLALDMTRDEALGLRIIERTNGIAFDLLANLVPHAPTLREAVGLCSQFSSLLVSGSHVVLEEKDSIARIKYAFRRLSARVDRMHSEHATVGFLQLFRLFAGRDTPIRRACFEHAPPSHREEYRPRFGGREAFAQPFTGIEFDRAYLDSRHLHQQPRMYSLLRGEADRALVSLANVDGHTERVRQYLMALPPSRIPKMAAAADTFRMSARSLRRRLAEEGVSYRELVQERLAETAAQVLRTPGKSVQDAAHATGFSDAAAFDRAFKQWTGMTPTEFRGTARGGFPRTQT